MIYLDASALITLISERPYANELQAFLADRPGMPMGTSSVGFIETVRTLDQIGDYPTILQDLARDFTEILLTDEVQDAAAALPSKVRTLDAIHIASAQIIGEAPRNPRDLRQAHAGNRPQRRHSRRGPRPRLTGALASHARAGFRVRHFRRWRRCRRRQNRSTGGVAHQEQQRSGRERPARKSCLVRFARHAPW